MRATHQQSQVARRTGQCKAECARNEPFEGFVANVSQILTLDKSFLTDRVGKLSTAKIELVLSGIDVILGR